MNILDFKKELELKLLITKWSPTESQLFEILKRIKGFSGKPDKFDIEKIVDDVVGPYEVMLLSGVDNTDLTTLLRLATTITK